VFTLGQNSRDNFFTLSQSGDNEPMEEPDGGIFPKETT